ncbi:GGDEF domain-containing protein [Paractinoplanes durhamensis]|nr:GGDEF domain-containing protein [Actinoplanes durhamensis]
MLYAAIVGLSMAALSNGVGSYSLITEAGRITLGVVGLVASIRAARTPGLSRRSHAAWRAVAVSFAVLTGTPIALLLFDHQRFTTADDVTHVVFVLTLLVAVQLFPLAPQDRRGRLKAGLDAGIVLVSGAMLLWQTAIGPEVSRHELSPSVILEVAVYPLADLALLYSVARALMRGAHTSEPQPLRLLAAGALVLFVGDAFHSYLHHSGQAAAHSYWQFLFWITADAVLASAALQQCAAPTRQAVRSLSFSAAPMLPFAAVAIANVLLLATAAHDGSLFPWGGVSLGVAAISALVLSRQAIVQRESDERALTDALTGLANRARFRVTSTRALERAARTGRSCGVLVADLNGFKEVNDTLGHFAGDQVLQAFAEVLRSHVKMPGLPCRLGGDEFAVVLPDLDGPRQAHQVAETITSALGPVAVGAAVVDLAASIGVAVSAPGELTHDQLVHRADVAMYQSKSHRPQTTWTSWQESYDNDSQAAA